MIEPGNLAQDWFFDQGWLDLVPSYFSDTAILRHPGYNVAFWNLLERRVTRSAAREDHGTTGPWDHGTYWRVEFGGEDLELVLYHFSLFDHRHPDRMTGEADYARIGRSADVDALIAEYVARLRDRGLEKCHQWPYDHGRFADGKAVSKKHRDFFKSRVFPGLADTLNPFDPAMSPKGLRSLYNHDLLLCRVARKFKTLLRSS